MCGGTDRTVVVGMVAMIMVVKGDFGIGEKKGNEKDQDYRQLLRKGSFHHRRL